MSVKIPDDFDVRKQVLDVCETDILDKHKIQITNWCKFRHTIAVGTESSRLKSTGGPVSDDVRDSCLSLGRSQYEVITSLGCTSFCLPISSNWQSVLALRFAYKSFYFHLGCLLQRLRAPRAEIAAKPLASSGRLIELSGFVETLRRLGLPSDKCDRAQIDVPRNPRNSSFAHVGRNFACPTDSDRDCR